jgi:hypothetical protein
MLSHNKSPLYFNISQIISYDQKPLALADTNQVRSNIQVYNDAPFLKDSSNYFIGVQRALIPTSIVPRLIVPICFFDVEGNVNTDPNKLLYTVSLAYRDNTGTILTSLSTNVIFISEIIGGRIPVVKNLTQDFDTSEFYYFVYDINTLLRSMNTTIISIFGKFIKQVRDLGLGIDTSSWEPPYFGFNQNNNKFTISAQKDFFNQDDIVTYDINGNPIKTKVARIEIYTGGLFEDLVQLPTSYLDKSLRAGNNNLLFNYIFTLNDGTATLNGDIMTMTSWKSSLNMWQAMRKVVFTILYGIPTKLEYESTIQSTGQLEATDDQNTFRPLKPTLTDLQVDINDFGTNNNYLQYSTSSISQIRLIDITTNQNLKDFSISVQWLSTFGRLYDLIIPTAHPLDLKLAFYPKTTTLI